MIKVINKDKANGPVDYHIEKYREENTNKIIGSYNIYYDIESQVSTYYSSNVDVYNIQYIISRS